MQNPNNNWWIQDGFNTAYGVVSDGVYGGSSFNGTGGTAPPALNLTTAWGVNAGYEHFWTPRWRTSLYGGYTRSNTTPSQYHPLLAARRWHRRWHLWRVANAGCDNNWTSWWVGSRTQWNVTKDFYMGLDVAYLKVDRA